MKMILEQDTYISKPIKFYSQVQAKRHDISGKWEGKFRTQYDSPWQSCGTRYETKLDAANAALSEVRKEHVNACAKFQDWIKTTQSDFNS